jgi:Mycoplasma protein of unknown function, DUF285
MASLRRNLCFLALLFAAQPCWSQQAECFRATDGYKYPGSGVPDPSSSVLGQAVRDYMAGDTVVRSTYGAEMNNWCVDAVTEFDFVIYNLRSINGGLEQWNVSSATTMRGMVSEGCRGRSSY